MRGIARLGGGKEKIVSDEKPKTASFKTVEHEASGAGEDLVLVADQDINEGEEFEVSVRTGTPEAAKLEAMLLRHEHEWMKQMEARASEDANSPRVAALLATIAPLGPPPKKTFRWYEPPPAMTFIEGASAQKSLTGTAEIRTVSTFSLDPAFPLGREIHVERGGKVFARLSDEEARTMTPDQIRKWLDDNVRAALKS